MSTLAQELGFLARKDLSLILDKHSPRGHDWRGLCDLMGFSYDVNIALTQQESPTLALLEEWERTLGAEATLDLLIVHLESLDCLEAVAVLKNAKAKKRERIDRGSLTSDGQLSPRSPRSPRHARLSTSSSGSNGPITPTSSLTSSYVQSHPSPSHTLDTKVLTEKIQKLVIEEEDVLQQSAQPISDMEKSLVYIQNQRYDVFLSYANTDREFAEEVRQRLTTQARLRVFVPLDELMPGFVFSDQIADMIKSGCRKTIIILSPNYIESEWCSYEARLALHQSPECRKHVLIPILYRRCDVPAFMQHIYYLDYPRYKDSMQCEQYFWQRLYKSLVYDGRRAS